MKICYFIIIFYNVACYGFRLAFCHVENLVPNKEYQFRVTAENLYGKGQPCEPTGMIKTEDDVEGRRRKGLGFDGMIFLYFMPDI